MLWQTRRRTTDSRRVQALGCSGGAGLAVEDALQEQRWSSTSESRTCCGQFGQDADSIVAWLDHAVEHTPRPSMAH